MKTKLNLGCGKNIRKTEYGTKYMYDKANYRTLDNESEWLDLDIVNLPGVDIVHDLEKPLPFKDNTFEEVNASHILEHIHNFIPLMEELHRVCKPEAIIKIKGPYFASSSAFQDPTHCFAEDTDILTQNGFKPIKDVKIGEEIFTLNPENLQVEISDCISTTNLDYNGEMIHFNTKRMDLLVTPNHNIFSGTNYIKPNWKISRADSLLNLKGHHSRKGFVNFDWKGVDTEYIEIPRIKRKGNKEMPIKFDAKTFFQFLGWYLSEGCVVSKKGKYYRIIISQKKDVRPENYEEIVEIIKKMNLNAVLHKDRIIIHSIDLYEYLKVLGHSKDKYIPFEIKQADKSLLIELLNTAIKGDGKKNNKGFEYTTISKKLSDDIQEIAIKCGFRTTQYIEKRKPNTIICGKKVNQAQIIYLIGITKNSELFYPKPNKINYKGKIVCITVEKNHLIFVRRNGRPIWAGNCRFFTLKTFNYFLEDNPNNFITKARFKIIKKQLKLTRRDWIINKPIEFIINHMQGLYERFFCFIFPSPEIHFELEVIK